MLYRLQKLKSRRKTSNSAGAQKSGVLTRRLFAPCNFARLSLLDYSRSWAILFWPSPSLLFYISFHPFAPPSSRMDSRFALSRSEDDKVLAQAKLDALRVCEIETAGTRSYLLVSSVVADLAFALRSPSRPRPSYSLLCLRRGPDSISSGVLQEGVQGNAGVYGNSVSLSIVHSSSSLEGVHVLPTLLASSRSFELIAFLSSIAG